MRAVEVKDLTFQYPNGAAALRGISFAIDEGECVGIIGPNGCGKSTLLLHLNGVLPEKLSGAQCVSIFGTPLTAETVSAARQQVGLLFQDPDDQLFCPTVYEDVSFGPNQFGFPDDETRQLVHRTLELVGLRGFEDRSPHHLSGGEKQRVCLAGILACRPKILALDEPTSNLDPRGKRELKGYLKGITVTTIIASHDLEMIVELCPRTIILDAGEIVADGATIELLNDEELMIRHGLEKPHSLFHRHPHR